MFSVVARHDWMDSVWDVWVSQDDAVVGHYRVVADGKYDATVDALVEHGLSVREAGRIAGGE